MARLLPKRVHCPSELTLAVLGGKWKTVILCNLKHRPMQYGELKKLIPNLSDKVLTERLRDLTDRGLVSKKKNLYELTALAQSLGPLLKGLYAWGKDNAARFGVEVDDTLKKLG